LVKAGQKSMDRNFSKPLRISWLLKAQSELPFKPRAFSASGLA